MRRHLHQFQQIEPTVGIDRAQRDRNSVAATRPTLTLLTAISWVPPTAATSARDVALRVVSGWEKGYAAR